MPFICSSAARLSEGSRIVSAWKGPIFQYFWVSAGSLLNFRLGKQTQGNNRTQPALEGTQQAELFGSFAMHTAYQGRMVGSSMGIYLPLSILVALSGPVSYHMQVGEKRPNNRAHQRLVVLRGTEENQRLHKDPCTAVKESQPRSSVVALKGRTDAHQ